MVWCATAVFFRDRWDVCWFFGRGVGGVGGVGIVAAVTHNGKQRFLSYLIGG